MRNSILQALLTHIHLINKYVVSASQQYFQCFWSVLKHYNESVMESNQHDIF